MPLISKRLGFSLLEVMIALGITLLLVGAVMGYQSVENRRVRNLKGRMDAQARVDLSFHEMGFHLRDLEPNFWQRFPRKTEASRPHEVDHPHGAVDFTNNCPRDKKSGCLLLWDVTTPTEQVRFLRVMAKSSNVDFILGAADPSESPELPASLQTGSVLLWRTGDDVQVALVSWQKNGRVVLLDPEAQPWAQNVVPVVGQVVTHLGTLEVTHVSLTAEPGPGHKLNYRPWYIRDGSWQNGRSWSGFVGLDQIRWLACTEELSDRVFLVSENQHAPRRPELIHVNDDFFLTKEAALATLLF